MNLSFRKQLARPQTSWQLCLLAILGGCASALLVVLFSFAVEAIQYSYRTYFINYNSLTFLSRLLLPIIGVVAILALSWLTGYQYIRAGIPFVLHRLKISYGVMPVKNTINQFFGGAFALASGFSVGKEGPSVHLGASFTGFFANKLKLPYNAIRTLCACGIAAGISACFNTPIAAVIFVMEVILREYKPHVFIPVMLAAIVGSLITSSVFGFTQEMEFLVHFNLNISTYPYLIFFGAFLGLLAAIFNNQLITLLKKSQNINIVKRLLLAAFLTALLSYIVPNSFSGGMAQISTILHDKWQFQMLAVLLIGKILMTIFALGLGIPGGIIGPVLSIGAIAGVLATLLISQLTGQQLQASDLALMGMAGFMAATLKAPLAALLAVVELSGQLTVVVPAMIIIAVSCLISGQLFKNRSIFTLQLDAQQLPYKKPPIENFLQDIGVLSFIQENIVYIDSIPTDNQFVNTNDERQPYYLLIDRSDKTDQDIDVYWYEQSSDNSLQQHLLFALSSQATLAEAYHILHNVRHGGVYIYHEEKDNVIGMIPFENIRHYLTQGYTA